MQIKETREFFQVQVIVKATSINEENLKIEFNGLNLYSEDEDKLVEIRNRRTVFEIDRCSEGLKIDIFILNEGTDPNERIDYLIDEDYEIEDIFIKVLNKKTNKEFSTKINSLIGEQVKKDVPIELAPELQETTDYLLTNLTEGNESLSNLILDTIKDSKSLETYIRKVMELEF